jgi:MFS family permease
MFSFHNLFKTQENLNEADVQRGLHMYILDGICAMGMVTVQGGLYLAAFALALGASQREIGLIASIGFLSQLMQLPGLYLVMKVPKRRAITLLTVGLSRLLWIPIILIPFFGNGSVSLLLLCLLIAALVGALPGPAWNSLIRDLIPSERLGEINGRRIVLGTVLSLLLTLGGGYFIDYWKELYPSHSLYGYAILFTVGLILGLAGLYAIANIPERTSSMASMVSLRELLTAPLRDGNFRALTIFLSLWTFAINMAAPFFLVYMLNRIHLSLFMVTVLVVTSQVVTILFLKIWGRLSDRFSNKTVLAVSGPMFLLCILLWCFTTMPDPHRFTMILLFAIQVLGGISVAGVTIGTSNIALKLSPEGMAHGYMTVISLAANIAGALGPIVGGIFADIMSTVQLEVPLILTTATQEHRLPILSFKSLDFLFALTFIVGLYAVHRLGAVKEEGEVDEREVIEGLLDSIIVPMRSLSVISGIRRVTVIPLQDLLSRLARNGQDTEADQ